MSGENLTKSFIFTFHSFFIETNNDFERYAAPVLGFQKGSNQAIPLWGLYNGKSLTGTDGIFAPMLKHFLESALQGELENHLSESKAMQVVLN